MNIFRKLRTTSYWMALLLAMSTCSEPEQPKPQIDSISPTQGTVGAQVEIFGKNFASVQSVVFGSTSSSIVTKSDTKIVTVVPVGLSPGSLAVIIKTDGGTSNSITFTVILSEPEITSIEPDRGSSGMEIILKGKHLATASTVTFGPAGVTTFSSKSDTEIKLTVPEDLELGALDVNVTTDGGTSANTTFTVVGKPTITSFSPGVGPVGKTIDIVGTNFDDASQVLFGGASATFQFLNSALIQAVVPVGAVSGKIKVITPGGEAVSGEDFVVKEAPIIGEFLPTMGIVGTAITINGINFDSDVTVKFGDVEATEVTVVSPTQLTVKIPSGAVTGPITIEAPAGSSTSDAIFTVIGFPVISSFSPDLGGIGTSVVIIGENFINVEEIKFHTTTVSSGNYEVISPTMINAKVPAGAATGRISIKTPAATVASAELFTIVPPPTITSFTPALGPPGKIIAITGTNFDEATNVFLGTSEAVFEIKSSTLIEMTVPLNAQTGKLKVVTLGGEASSATNFIVKEGPEITSFSPASGIVGTVVTINGKNFDAPPVVVKFGTGTANSVTVVNATQITAIVPASGTTGKISVETAAASVLSAANFTVIGAPVVTQFAPSGGAFGTDVVITGSNFVNVSAVKFNNTDVPPANYTIVSNTTINAKVPTGSLTGKISVTTPAGTGVSGNNFTVYPPPTVTSFTPMIGPVGTTVAITGTNFTGTTQVFVGTTAAAFSVNGATEIEITVPAGSVTGKIKVITPGGEALSTDNFIVKDPPTITSFSPASGIVGSVVTINGTDFDAGGVSVKFGTGTATTLTVVSPTQITATVPAAATSGKITIVTAAGSVLSASNFTVIGVPTITSFNPATGGVGTDIVITGTNFINVSSIKFDNTTVTAGNFTVVSATTINVKVPAGASTGKISVTTPAGTAVSSGDFTVLLPPTITSFNPSSGPTGGSVVITGTEFTGVTAVLFNDVNAGSFTINSSTQITASVPANGTSGKIKVTNGAGTATSGATFYVTPYIVSVSPTVGSVGTLVTITGTNLAGATVDFSGTPAVTSTNTNTSITVAVPSITNGSKNVTVTNLGGTSNSRSFLVTDPVILDEVIADANIKGQLILLKGSNLQGATNVLFGNISAPVVTNTPILISTVIPNSLSAGNYTVKAVTSNGTSNGQSFEVLTSQVDDTGGVTLTNGVTVVPIPGGYVPPISNLWESQVESTEAFSIQEVDVDVIEVEYQKDGEPSVFGTNVVFDLANNYVEFTVSGVRYVGMYTPATYVDGVDCYHYITLISAESGRQLTIRVSTFNDGCPF